MINLTTPYFAVILGCDELKRQAPEGAIAAALVIESYPLSADESAAHFTMHAPGDASVDSTLLEALSRMPTNVEALGLRIALVRWSEGTESVVGYPSEQTVPSPALLKSAYRNGYQVARLKALLAARAEEHGHG